MRGSLMCDAPARVACATSVNYACLFTDDAIDLKSCQI